ncbi:MFS transporter [Limosilactobacillus sp.]|uniref:MFS transporter n=1 Tax=Limosilactobacillus sp. TaxID=2773925 RepID=UPI0025C5D17E|nr:MFS transporter [Limosilactobacillus sp.]MCH3921550.1 MFS transporter [Limosilactobacillus sp.]MCH3928321.1 MFS transporter [Limosilactobacillus sp.]
MRKLNDNYIELPRYKVIFLATCVGVIVASMFYIQPIENVITVSYQIKQSQTAVIAMLTQVSYALGLLLVVPLGDMFNRYRFLQVMEAISICSLLLASWAPSPVIFALASVLIGLTSVGGQIIIPYVAYLTPLKKQGPILGVMISGMLTGILFARTFSGLIAAALGWHMVYLIAAVLNFLLLILIHQWVPNDPREHGQDISLGQLLASLPKLLKKYRYLRSSAVNGFAMFGLANLFWSTLAFLLMSRFHYGSAVAGSMGLLGIVAIFAAPFIGRMVNLYSPKQNIVTSIILAIVAYLIFGAFQHSMVALVIGIIVLDLSTQFSQVTNQAIIQSLSRTENSRNNSIFMFSYFFGGSIGTLTGIDAWSHFGWAGVTAMAVIFVIVALSAHFAIGEPEKLG